MANIRVILALILILLELKEGFERISGDIS